MPTVNASNPLLADVARTGEYSALLNPPPFMPMGGIWPHTGSSGASGGIWHGVGPTWALITSLVVSGTDQAGNDRSALLAQIQVGDYVSVWWSPTSYAIAQVSGVNVAGSVYTFTVTNIASVGNVDASFAASYYFGLIYRPPMSLATVATTGDYGDLTGTPDLSIYATTAAVAAAYVPQTLTINGYALSGNITLVDSDIYSGLSTTLNWLDGDGSTPHSLTIVNGRVTAAS